MKSGNLNFLEPSGPPQAFNGTALPLPTLMMQGHTQIKPTDLFSRATDVADLHMSHIPEDAAQVGIAYNVAIFSIERGSTGSRSLEKSLWKRLWTCRRREYAMKG